MRKLLLILTTFTTLIRAEWTDAEIVRFTEIESIVAEASEEYDVPYNRLVALLYVESRFKADSVSPTGALGIAQFTKATAKRFKVNPKNVTSSIRGAARLLRYHFDNTITSFTNEQRWNLSCIYYNRGKGYHFKAKRYMRKHKVSITYNNLLKYYKRYSYMQEGLNYIKAIKKQIKLLESYR